MQAAVTPIVVSVRDNRGLPHRSVLLAALALAFLVGACAADPPLAGPQPDYSGPQPNQTVNGSMGIAFTLAGWAT